jgi:hypothetical protein
MFKISIDFIVNSLLKTKILPTLTEQRFIYPLTGGTGVELRIH